MSESLWSMIFWDIAVVLFAVGLPCLTIWAWRRRLLGVAKPRLSLATDTATRSSREPPDSPGRRMSGPTAGASCRTATLNRSASAVAAGRAAPGWSSLEVNANHEHQHAKNSESDG